MSTIEELKAENARLRAENTQLKSRSELSVAPEPNLIQSFSNVETQAKHSLSIVVIGASGDLAWKKTFPALFSLYCNGLLPEDVVIAGYSRSKMDHAKFSSRISQKFAAEESKNAAKFLSQSFYYAGQYDSADDFANFQKELLAKEEKICAGSKVHDRIFYMAIPPTLFTAVGKGIQPAAMSTTGFNRVVVEKPFGHDSESSKLLGQQLAALFHEQQIFRIDHYLGKEMVQNLMVLRFANKVFEPLWNRDNIGSIQITFKEDFGTKGRGGYFDKFGIIRDVMQNHLLQILSLVAMEPPVSLTPEDVRNEKVKLLRAIAPITKSDMVIGQYDAAPDGSEPSYLGDETVPDDSVTPTFATAVLHINNTRWAGTPFILKCGKALNERKAEIRIQFKQPVNGIFKNEWLSNNELVMRVQPDLAVYLKMSTKKPGLSVKGNPIQHTELDLSYGTRFEKETKKMPDAYERLIYDVYRGDHNLFVRADELVAAWKIFTPILHQLEKEKVRPILYKFGSRGPPESDALIKKYGYARTTAYVWKENQQTKA